MMKIAKKFGIKNRALILVLVGACFASFTQMALAVDKEDGTVKRGNSSLLESDKAGANNDASVADAHREEVRHDRRDELRERHIEEHHEHN